MGRHAGQTGDIRSRSPQARGGAAVLTDPRGILDAGPRGAGDVSLPTPFPGIGSLRRLPHDLPPIGTPEHTALMSGSLDLTELLAAQERAPLLGFPPIVLDATGPANAEGDAPVHDHGGGGRPRDDVPAEAGAPVTRGAGPLPSRRSLRGVRAQLPTPRNGISLAAAPAARPAPPTVTGSPTGPLCVADMRASLAAMPVPPAEDPTPTGELARPFVNETSLADWVTLDDVPPPVSVDVFQRAVRAGLAPEEAGAALAAVARGSRRNRTKARTGGRTPSAGPAQSAPEAADAAPADAAPADAAPADQPVRRTRREMRARERALGSIRGVTARRLAKGGVLAVTALGVVSSATPQTLGALGLDHEDLATRGAIDFAGAVAPKLTAPELSPEAAAARQQLQRERNLHREMADAAADAAAHAGTTTGAALLELAFKQDELVETRRRQALERAAREVARNPRKYAALMVAERGWPSREYGCLNLLWNRESMWSYRAENPSSGAYGIPQALPGHKMAAAGPDWQTNPMTQIKWGLNYISKTYGTPCRAWAHSRATGWY